MPSSSLLANIVLLLSVFHLAVAASEPRYIAGAAKLESNLKVRQASATPSQADACLDYERTANLSTVGANSSYRTVFMQKVNLGTIYSMRLMDDATAKLPALTANQTLNKQCGV